MSPTTPASPSADESAASNGASEPVVLQPDSLRGRADDTQPNHDAGASGSASAIDALRERKAKALQGGGAKRIESQHAKGKYTARERIELLLDAGTFVEMDPFVRTQATTFGLDKNRFDGDGVVCGHGTIDGRLVFVYSQDFTVLGGSLGHATGQKIAKTLKQAMQMGAPVIGFNDSGGARIQEGVASLAGYGDIFFKNVEASGVVPQISVIVGPSAGGAVYSPALTDFVIMTDKTSHMFVTGPDVVKTVTGEEATQEELGGATVHEIKSGVASFSGLDEDGSIALIRKLLSYLPSNNLGELPIVEAEDPADRRDPELDTLVPSDPGKPYDVRDVVDHVVDVGSFFEVQPRWAQNLVVGFGRMAGVPVGIVANQPAVLAGALDIEASIKGAKFIRFCDAFNIPIISFVDVPGFLPGLGQEHGGIIRNGAKLLYAYCEATVPKLSVVLRKSYGGAYIVMGSKHVGTDCNLSWPAAEIAVMGASGAVEIIHKRKLAALAEDDPEEAARLKEAFTQEYQEAFNNPYVAAERGWIDDIIEPRETRPRLIAALLPALNKRETRPEKKHGLTPL